MTRMCSFLYFFCGVTTSTAIRDSTYTPELALALRIQHDYFRKKKTTLSKRNDKNMFLMICKIIIITIVTKIYIAVAISQALPYLLHTEISHSHFKVGTVVIL